MLASAHSPQQQRPIQPSLCRAGYEHSTCRCPGQLDYVNSTAPGHQQGHRQQSWPQPGSKDGSDPSLMAAPPPCQLAPRYLPWPFCSCLSHAQASQQAYQASRCTHHPCPRPPSATGSAAVTDTVSASHTFTVICAITTPVVGRVTVSEALVGADTLTDIVRI